MMKRIGFVMTLLCASAGAASAQMIDIWNSVGPSGTHFNLELPCTSYLYQCTTTCSWSYRHTFKVLLNGSVKYTTTFDVIGPSGSTPYQNLVDMTNWGLKVGNIVDFHSRVVILSGPYRNQSDEDHLYGDVVDLIPKAPSRPADGLYACLPADAIDDKSRFETMLFS